MNGGPYTTVASQAATGYNDTGLVNGATYYYVVSAVNLGGESANSIQASAAFLPLPFWNWASRPVMGWNSWDFYGTSINETCAKAQTDYQAANLLSHGWSSDDRGHPVVSAHRHRL